jgi:hypothetical protein
VDQVSRDQSLDVQRPAAVVPVTRIGFDGTTLIRQQPGSSTDLTHAAD